MLKLNLVSVNDNFNKKIKLAELFNSYQGEAPYVGLKTTFVRFYKCNLECPWCDTMYNKHEINFTEYSLNEIISYISKTHRVTFTGGEPSLFLDDVEVIWNAIKEAMIYIDLITFETNGTRLPKLLNFIETTLAPVKNITSIIWSPKFYSKAIYDNNLRMLYNRILEEFENIYIKIVADKSAEGFIRQFLSTLKDLYGYFHTRKVYIMPLTVEDENGQYYIPKESWEYAKQLANEYEVNLSPRLHIESNLK